MPREPPSDGDALVAAVRRRRADPEFRRQLEEILEDDRELLRRLEFE